MSLSPCLPLMASGDKETIVKVVCCVLRQVPDWGELNHYLEGPVLEGGE